VSAEALQEDAQPREALAGEQLTAWEQSVDTVAALGFEAEAAERIVERSFGWGGSQGYWRGSKVRGRCRRADACRACRAFAGAASGSLTNGG